MNNSTWARLTDDECAAVMNGMPGGCGGYLTGWGWLAFARAIEERLRLKNARKPVAVIFDEDGAQVVVPFADTQFAQESVKP